MPVTRAAVSGLGQEPLDNHFRPFVFTFAVVVVPDTSLGVGEVQGGPVVVAEGEPHRVVIVDRDRVIHPHLEDSPADVLGVFLE
jgi:hypothetical protein